MQGKLDGFETSISFFYKAGRNGPVYAIPALGRLETIRPLLFWETPCRYVTQPIRITMHVAGSVIFNSQCTRNRLSAGFRRTNGSSWRSLRLQLDLGGDPRRGKGHKGKAGKGREGWEGSLGLSVLNVSVSVSEQCRNYANLGLRIVKQALVSVSCCIVAYWCYRWCLSRLWSVKWRQTDIKIFFLNYTQNLIHKKHKIYQTTQQKQQKNTYSIVSGQYRQSSSRRHVECDRRIQLLSFR